jgi:hypothetical protein
MPGAAMCKTAHTGLISAISLLAAAYGSAARIPSAAGVDVKAIIQRSVDANQRDWQAEPEYSCSETVRNGKDAKTYQIMMLFGSPYKKLIRINGKPLSSRDQKDEESKFQNAVRQRRAESPSAKAKRVAEYQKDRERDHLMMEQLTRAFDFRMSGRARIAGRSVYVLSATPRKDYQPPNTEARVLKGMRGTLWIDQQTSQWVKVVAEVMSPVTIEGFLATVEPGTRFELEKMPVSEGIWLPKHFSVRSHARVLGMFHHQSSEDDTWFDYHKTPAESTQAAGASAGK